jgi:eukaryotic-like serine/threonine-protein kinase
MARSASKEGLGADGTRFGESVADAALGDLAPKLGRGALLLGKYRLEVLLGEGGMGAVWQAQHLQLDLPVALKLLRAGPDRATLSERLKIEARAAARLVHPAIVRVFDIDASEGGEPFIVMELLAGESLADLLDRGRLSGVSAVQTLLPIAEALVLAHAKGIIHRDLKPHNVFLAKEEERMQPKLLDFGIAKLTTATMPAGSLTDTGILLGSPDYMSPEQARGSNDVDFRADIWQFCVVLYEAVSCRTPFEGDNYNALMRAIVEDDPAPLPLDDSLDHRLADLILWGLAKRREERPESMQELGRSLAQWLIDRGVTEDMFGASLSAKWITRSAQKSLPVVQLEAIEVSRGPEPAPEPVPNTDTLLSPRIPSVARGAAAALAPEPTPKGLSRPWPIALGVVLLLGAIAWAVTRPSAPKPIAASPVAAPSPVAVKAQASAVPPAPTLAATPATPSSSDTTPPADPLLSASPLTRGSSFQKPRSAVPSSSASPAARPAPVGHDETRELLQAY